MEPAAWRLRLLCCLLGSCGSWLKSAPAQPLGGAGGSPFPESRPCSPSRAADQALPQQGQTNRPIAYP